MVVQIIQPILARGMQSRTLQKPVLVITITDGEPTGEPRPTVVNVIKQAKNMCMNSQYGPGAITFEFAQVSRLSCFPRTIPAWPVPVCNAATAAPVVIPLLDRAQCQAHTEW